MPPNKSSKPIEAVELSTGYAVSFTLPLPNTSKAKGAFFLGSSVFVIWVIGIVFIVCGVGLKAAYY
jgi:hypothetical protein